MQAGSGVAVIRPVASATAKASWGGVRETWCPSPTCPALPSVTGQERSPRERSEVWVTHSRRRLGGPRSATLYLSVPLSGLGECSSRASAHTRFCGYPIWYPDLRIQHWSVSWIWVLLKLFLLHGVTMYYSYESNRAWAISKVSSS